MADFFILLPAGRDDSPLFAWRSGGGWTCAEQRPGNRFGEGENAVAFVPGTMVTAHRTDIVARKPAEARRTALFALEDDLAQPVEQLHIALGPAGEGASREVHVASLDDMQRWVSELTALGLPEADILACHAVLPAGQVGVDAIEELLFRDAGLTFACDSAAPDDLLRSIAPEELGDIYGDTLARRLGVAASADGPSDRATLLGQLAEFYQAGTPSGFVSLRQGDFTVRRALELKGLDKWRIAGGLASAAFVLWLGSMWMETSALKRQATELRTQTSMIVTNVVPEANGNVSAALASMRQSQRAASVSMRPTTATAALYEAVVPTEDAEVRSLRFDANTGRLVAMVIFDNYSEADAIGERLEDMGLSVALGEARQSGTRVLGEFTIEAAS